jgi:hypothetical protein
MMKFFGESFVNYARHCGLDDEQVLAEFNKIMTGTRNRNQVRGLGDKVVFGLSGSFLFFPEDL